MGVISPLQNACRILSSGSREVVSTHEADISGNMRSQHRGQSPFYPVVRQSHPKMASTRPIKAWRSVRGLDPDDLTAPKSNFWSTLESGLSRHWATNVSCR